MRLPLSCVLPGGASASLALDVVDANGVVLTHIPELAPLTLLQPEGPIVRRSRRAHRLD